MTLGSLKSVGVLMATLSFGIVTLIVSFVPSSVDYAEKPSNIQDQIAMPTNSQPQVRSEGNASTARNSASRDSNEISDRSQEPRFGFTNIGSTGSVRTCYGIAKRAADAVREANDISEDEKVTSFDRMVENLTTNQVFRTAMRGTAIQDAVEAGRGGQNCSRTYRHCGFSLETILGLVSNVMSSMAAHNDSGPTAPSGSL